MTPLQQESLAELVRFEWALWSTVGGLIIASIAFAIIWANMWKSST
jgi:uncharacterized membrane protein